MFFSGLVLQDLTFVHIGNPDRLPDGCVNFSKCWQMFMILDHMRRFGKWYVVMWVVVVELIDITVKL